MEFHIDGYLNWKIAICYHPMFMLVDEDRGIPTLGERVPPWGTATVEAYLERVKRNLDSLEQDENLTLNYEWAVCAIEDIYHRFPQVFERMKKLYMEGRLSFVGVDYSLTHANGQGSEACYRQIQYGQEAFQVLFGNRVRVFAHQETHIFEQLPAILKKFGVEFMVVPSFPWKLKIDSAFNFELCGDERGFHITKNNEFVQLKSLGKESLPLYIPTNVRQTTGENEIAKGLWSSPTLWIDFPDLEEYHNPQPYAATVVLEKELAERYVENPPKASATISTDFSYIEGIWAEEHLRFSRMAEEKLLLCEAVHAVCGIRTVDFVPLWKRLLKYEDHDVTWVEITDLRRKAVAVFQELIHQVDRLIRNTLSKDSGQSTLVNVLPYGRKTVVEVDPANIPADLQVQRYGEKYWAVAALAAVQMKPNKPGGTALCSLAAAVPDTIDFNGCRIDLSEEKLIAQITLPGGEKTLNPDSGYLGGEIRAVENLLWEKETKDHYSTHNNSVTAKAAEEKRVLCRANWVDNRTASSSYYKGPVFDVLHREGKIGSIPFEEDYCFFKNMNAIKVELKYVFSGNSIGEMHMEETKMNVYYPTLGREVHHDVPFGIVQGEEGNQIYATNWLNCGNINFINRGVPKAFVKNGVIASTFAWGSRQWTNHIHFDFWMERCETYDLRLYGTQHVEYWINLCESYDEVDVTRAVEGITMPITCINGSLARKTAYSTVGEAVAYTSVYLKEGAIAARGYQLTNSDMRDREIVDLELKRGGI